MPKSTSVGSKIKAIRTGKNMSQERFGEKVGLSGKAISCYETGRIVPPLKVLESISNEYNVPITSVSNKYKVMLREKLLQAGNLIQELSQILDCANENIDL